MINWESCDKDCTLLVKIKVRRRPIRRRDSTHQIEVAQDFGLRDPVFQQSRKLVIVEVLQPWIEVASLSQGWVSMTYHTQQISATCIRSFMWSHNTGNPVFHRLDHLLTSWYWAFAMMPETITKLEWVVWSMLWLCKPQYCTVMMNQLRNVEQC